MRRYSTLFHGKSGGLDPGGNAVIVKKNKCITNGLAASDTTGA